MTTPVSAFDDNVGKWLDEGSKPWSKLKYKLTEANLALHLPPGPLRVLDAGGGDGKGAIAFAKQGHQVVLVDYSPAMLDAAKTAAVEAGVDDRIAFHQAELSQVGSLFAPNTFDVVLCHNVIQYVGEPREAMRGIANVVKPGGFVSIIATNRYATPLVNLFMRNDFEAAIASVGQRDDEARLFGVTLRQYSADELAAIMADVGCSLAGHYGIACVTWYWGTNELKHDPANMAQLERLEFAMKDLDPYRLMARFVHVICRRD